MLSLNSASTPLCQSLGMHVRGSQEIVKSPDAASRQITTQLGVSGLSPRAVFVNAADITTSSDWLTVTAR